MPLLTQIQRNTLVNQLKINAKPKGFANRFTKMFESQKTRDAAVEECVRELDGAYNRAIAACQTLRNHHAGSHTALCDRFDQLVGEIEANIQNNVATIDIAELTHQTATLGNLKNAIDLADANPGVASTLENDCQGRLQTIRDGLDILGRHPQRGHVTGLISAHERDYSAAKNFYDCGNFQEARRILRRLDAQYPETQTHVDNYATFVFACGEAGARIRVYETFDEDAAGQLETRRLQIKDTITHPGDNYTLATNNLNNISLQIKNEIKNTLDGTAPNTGDLFNSIDEIERTILNDNIPNQYIRTHVDELTNLKDSIVDDLNNDRVKQAMLGVVAFTGRYLATLHACERYAGYKAFRRPVATALIGLQVSTKGSYLEPVRTNLNTSLTAIDAEFNARTKELKRAKADLEALKVRCDEGQELVNKIDEYRLLRTQVDQRLANLRLHPEANGQLAPAIAAIGAQMPAVPANNATAAASPNLAVWAGWVKQLQWAARELTKYEQLAAPFTAIEAAGILPQNAGDPNEVRQALQRLQVQLIAARNLRNQISAQLVGNQPVPMENELADLEQLLTDATTTTNLAQGAGDEAAQLQAVSTSLNGGGDTLKMIWVTLLEYEAIATRHEQLDVRLATVEQSPEYLGRIALAVANTRTRLVDALAFPDTRSAQSALQLLDNADAEIAGATELLGERSQFNTLYADTRAELAKLSSPLGRQDADLQNAVNLADALDFAGANRQLEELKARIFAASLGKRAKGDPDHAAFMVEVKALLSQQGGGTALDEAISNAPQNFSAELLKEIAKERFGIEFTVETSDKKGFMARRKENKAHKISTQRLYTMLSKVPEDVIGNPSLQKVTSRDTKTTEAYYSPADKEAVMLIRPDKIWEEFDEELDTEKAKLNYTLIEDECKPDNYDPVDFFDFATLHEVGHAVDDQLAFMDRHLNDDAYGGWRTHSDIGPIVTAVANHYAYNTTPAQLDYVREVLLGGTPTPPTPPAGSEVAWGGAVNRIKAWRKITSHKATLWDRDEFSRTAAIAGRVYHEAYENRWVSYNVDARNRGITSYQFRAPGEWFAELYAAYHSGKLKDTHPAVTGWLSTL